MSDNSLLEKAREYIKRETHAHFKDEVEELVRRNDVAELSDRFYADLEFGTGGLRGKIGGGYNRMNPFTVRRATQGLADYIRKTAGLRSASHGSVVIAYDSRHFSAQFALEAGLVLAANNIKVWLFSGIRPTPELSFAVRRLGAVAGIVVTASHNPPEYNGYKVYWSDGGQVTAPHDAGIIASVRAMHGEPGAMIKEEAIAKKLLVEIDEEIDKPFLDMVTGCSLRPDLVRQKGKEFRVVYTPLHGTGAVPVARSLSAMGIEVIFVPQQREPDGDFPTVKYPNPEEPEAMRMALALGEKVRASLVMGTDPDADRLAVGAPDNGALTLLTGNQLGALLADYIFSTRREQGTLPPKPVLVKTIVTTELQRLIAQEYGAICIDTLTGFKYIGEKIREFEADPAGPQYLVGGEESYGYLVNTEVRDKDAVSAALLAAEMALYYAQSGRTLFDRLRAIWKKHGYFEEALLSKTFPGEAGLAKMKDLMERLRRAPVERFAGERVMIVRDFLEGTTWRPDEKKRERDLMLPASNVLQFVLEDESIVTMRPSGTEPKIKFYASCRSKPGEDLGRAIAHVHEKIAGITRALENLVQ